jgi:pimeloyl-ACP methyl ester carboxylesterase
MEYTINGRRLSVDVHGAGEPLLLIHGLGGTANSWAPVVAAFASTMQVIVPDLPGAGRWGCWMRWACSRCILPGIRWAPWCAST